MWLTHLCGSHIWVARTCVWLEHAFGSHMRLASWLTHVHAPSCPTKLPMNAKKLEKFSSLIAATPSLLTTRSTDNGTLALDGWTALHAVSSKGNTQLLALIIAEDTRRSTVFNSIIPQPLQPYATLLNLKDMQGRTPLHIACIHGEYECAALLRTAMSAYGLAVDSSSSFDPIGVNAPVDLSGRTPIGWAAAAADKHGSLAAKKVAAALPKLQELLYKDGDWSVCPATPVRGREGGGGLGELSFGYGDCQGWRANMEDSVCCHYPAGLGFAESWGLFGVFDGHGGRDVSDYVGENFRDVLVAGGKWGERTTGDALEECCLRIDETMQDASTPFEGGSTGIVGLVTDNRLIVCNVGDSRAVLVTKKEGGGGE